MHALALLNDTTYVEAARVMAEDVLQESDSSTERLSAIFQRTLSRAPDSEEAEILKRHVREFEASPGNAMELLATGDWPIATALDPVEHAAWTLLCLSVLNLDETLNKG